MIPVSLTIKGLYSYKEPATIDFTNLTSSGLFGIFGAVGSGKSSILEAISFALYGQIERLNSKEGRAYNMMNLQSTEMFIEFIFTCGLDSKYKFVVKTTRNKKNFLDVKAVERKAYRFERNDWVSIDPDGESVVGLSYDNFKRTIIIPQGKFQEFLQLTESQRVEMLKDIFNLGKFELGHKALRLAKENDLKVKFIEGELEVLPNVTQQILEEKNKSIVQTEKMLERLTNELSNKRIAQSALFVLKQQHEELQSKSSTFEILKKDEYEFSELEKNVIRYEQCYQLFTMPIKERQKLQEKKKNLVMEVEKYKGEKKILEVSIKLTSAKVDQFRESYESREKLLLKATELETILSIKSISLKIQGLDERIKNGETEIFKVVDQMDMLQRTLDSVSDEILSAQEKLPDAANLVELNNWFNLKKQFEDNLCQLEIDLDKIEKRETLIYKKITADLQSCTDLIDLTDPFQHSTEVKCVFDEKKEEIEREILDLESQLLHIQVLQKLDDFAKDLADESECPLCGSTHHPNIFSTESVKDKLHFVEDNISKLKANRLKLQSYGVNLSISFSELESQKEDKLKSQESKIISQESFDAFKKSFLFNGYTQTDSLKVQSELIALKEGNNALATLRTQKDNLQKQVSDLNDKKGAYSQKIEHLRTERAKFLGQSEELRNQVKQYEIDEVILLSDDDLSKRVFDLKEQHTAIVDLYEKSIQTLEDESRSLDKVFVRLEGAEKQVESIDLEVAVIEQQMKALLQTSVYRTEQDVVEVLSNGYDVNKEKGRIEEYKRQVHSIGSQLTELKNKLAGQFFDPEVLKDLNETIPVLDQHLVQEIGLQGKAKGELQDLKNKMAERAEKEKQFNALLLRGENLKVLTSLFKASGFVNYVSSVYLQNLVNAANERFYKMTGQKLSLEIDEDNAFRVKDFMNNGQVRSVKTLSGGQTFQAALSLALALADNIQHLTKSKQNFFFLDEGFGSLDREALAVVFDTLKNLRKENRIVGVISHVDEMQQEIPVNLKVVNDSERGSIIKCSWN